jgi:cellobiose dehydrogenase (acceptor)
MSANRSGILAQVAPNLGPMFWQQLNGSDGVVRHIQWQARIEGRIKSTGLHSLVHVDTNIVAASMTITQYLGMGTTSRGRMGITPSLNTRVMTPPYLRDQHDKEAVVQGIEYIRGVLSQIQNLTWIEPRVNQTTTAFVNSVSQLFSVVMTCCKSNDSLNRYPRHLVPEVRTTGPGLAR